MKDLVIENNKIEYSTIMRPSKSMTSSTISQVDDVSGFQRYSAKHEENHTRQICYDTRYSVRLG